MQARLIRLGAPAALALAAALGCAPGAAPAAGAAPAPAPGQSLPATRADGPIRRSADPATALARGWMPLASTAVPAFLAQHPSYDGRGVLIGILDSGTDPGVPGLDSTSTGTPKLLDVRDFSGEGRVALEPIPPLSPEGPWYRGHLVERRLGAAPAADVNGDGDTRDTLALVVSRDSAGWFLLADTDLDGSLTGERRVRDYARERGTVTWSRAGAEPRIHLAVNLAEQEGEPVLDLYFDTSGHGTHVAGIAAGHRIYGVDGFDGVAPGAQLLGLKIADNAHGAVSTTGSMLAAINYAIGVAAERGMPLVLNMSFGVGNEREGRARIDAIVDSVLGANPGLVFTISAGNDGPGLSTIGFPGSSTRALSIGATLPGVFLAAPTGAQPPDRIAYFSARGGELAKPDLVAPGVAYSTVPRWNAGQERSGGTSMAAPHAAGLAALLISGLVQEGRPVRAADVRAALLATAVPVEGASAAAAGAGVPDAPAAWRWLAAGRRAPDVDARAAGSTIPAALHQTARGEPVPTGRMFELLRPRAAPRVTYYLRSDAAWLHAPDSVVAGGGVSRLPLTYDAAALRGPGVWTGAITGWSADTAAGPAFRLLNTVITPYTADSLRVETGSLAPSAVSRIVFIADTGRGFRVSIAGVGAATAFLHEPGGRPYRGGQARPAGSAERPGVFEVDASDSEAGTYELVVAAPPVQSASAAVEVRQSPVRLDAQVQGSVLQAAITAVGSDTISAEAMLLLIGAERPVAVRGVGGAEQQITVKIPEWAASATIDVRHPAGQWERFTDFGVTLFAGDGRIIEQSPLNYAFGRLSFDLDAGLHGSGAVLSLLPGLADPASAEAWTVDVSIRFYAAAPVAVAPLDSTSAFGAPGSAPLVLAPGAVAVVQYPMTGGPWPLGDGFHSLAVLVAEAGGAAWSREVGIPGPALTGSR